MLNLKLYKDNKKKGGFRVFYNFYRLNHTFFTISMSDLATSYVICMYQL